MKPIDTLTLSAGDLYAFSPSDNTSETSTVWGIFDMHSPDGHIHLESSSDDYQTFRTYTMLPEEYLYARPATRDELRDYAYNLGYNRQ